MSQAKPGSIARLPDERWATEGVFHREEGPVGCQYPILNLSTEARGGTFDRLARGSCNIAGTWPRRAPAVQSLLVMV